MIIIQVIKVEDNSNMPNLVLDDEGYVWRSYYTKDYPITIKWEKVDMSLPYELKPIAERK